MNTGVFVAKKAAKLVCLHTICKISNYPENNKPPEIVFRRFVITSKF